MNKPGPINLGFDMNEGSRIYGANYLAVIDYMARCTASLDVSGLILRIELCIALQVEG